LAWISTGMVPNHGFSERYCELKEPLKLKKLFSKKVNPILSNVLYSIVTQDSKPALTARALFKSELNCLTKGPLHSSV
jgi:hypothetical protein